jgi:hypothetical protein
MGPQPGCCCHVTVSCWSGMKSVLALIEYQHLSVYVCVNEVDVGVVSYPA